MVESTRRKQCLSCGCIWMHAPGDTPACTACEYLYVRWLNYEELAQSYRQANPNGQAFGGLS
jgi:hypothetical protein